MPTIKNIHAREILDSRGFPTVEVELSVEDPKRPGELLRGRAAVPSGASTGEGEALELRDGDAARFLGKGVKKAVANVNEKIRTALVGRSFSEQAMLDSTLCDLDGTPNKAKLGANAILGVSMAFCRALSLEKGIPTYRLISQIMGTKGVTLPVPLNENILNGGKHADNGLAIQEFMILPAGFTKFSEALRAGTEVFHCLKRILHKQGLSTAVGDEGGFAPVFQGDRPHEQALSAIIQAISDAGYKAGREIFLALDCAASEYLEARDSNKYRFEGKLLSSTEMVAVYSKWVDKYPILSIEDGLAEHDWDGWSHLTRTFEQKSRELVGDGTFVTNSEFLRKGIDQKVGNSILIKLNQIGAVAETLATMKLAFSAGYTSISSHRSGATRTH